MQTALGNALFQGHFLFAFISCIIIPIQEPENDKYSDC